jgi:DNA-binding MarR family transcriptional regulator
MSNEIKNILWFDSVRHGGSFTCLRFQQLLEQKGVTVTEWVALRTLWSQDVTTHAELIDALGMTKGAASKVVSRLEKEDPKICRG